MTAIEYEWRGPFTNDEVNVLHAEAFGTRVFTADEWDWVDLTARHSLGWVVARDGGLLAGFVNVVWDGSHRGRSIGTRLVGIAKQHAREAGCEWLHVDFDPELSAFYVEACGFRPTSAGLIALAEDIG
jgi:GNAT superfamily N-acetyltransferase